MLPVEIGIATELEKRADIAWEEGLETCRRYFQERCLRQDLSGIQGFRPWPFGDWRGGIEASSHGSGNVGPSDVHFPDHGGYWDSPPESSRVSPKNIW
ncbi:hypothetical protein U1Q18_034631 [Sarracenia purpurea var. burkii]